MTLLKFQKFQIKVDKQTQKDLSIHHKDILDSLDILNILSWFEIYPEKIVEFSWADSVLEVEVLI